MFDLIHDKLKEIHPGKNISKDKHTNGEGIVNIYHFNVCKKGQMSWFPYAVGVYDRDYGKFCMGISSKGDLEKELELKKFFDGHGIKSKVISGIEKNSSEIMRIPYNELKIM